MMKTPFDNACKLCSRPFTTFRWRPGGRGKFLSTEICQTCAKLRNACQSCVLDLVYKLPVQLRDQITGANGAAPVMMNEVHREYFADQAERKLADGSVSQQTFGKAPPMPKMVGVARTLTPYFRELGLATGGAGAGGGDLDPTNTSLYVGGIVSTMTEAQVRESLEGYGKIVRVAMVTKNHCAFVEFADRSAAEAAFVGCGGTVLVGPAKVVCSVNWSKSKKKNTHRDDDAAEVVVPPPPGVKIPGGGAAGGASLYPSASGKFEGSAVVKR